MHFFDTTPAGRILNRFSKDVLTADQQLPETVITYLSTSANVLTTIVMISTSTPFFLPCLIPIFFIYIHAQRFYINTSREVKRLDSVSRSPIYAFFSEVLTGLMTIRAFQAQGTFMERMYMMVDRNQRVRTYPWCVCHAMI